MHTRFALSATLAFCRRGGRRDRRGAGRAQAGDPAQRVVRPDARALRGVQPAFAKYWKGKTGQDVTIHQSHGGSGKQARSVIDGLEADVVTLALAYDIDEIAEKAGLLPGQLADAAAQQQLALHLDHRVPGAQGQPEGHQGLGRPGQAGRLGDHARTRRPRAARAGTTWRPGPGRLRQPGGNEAKAKDFVAKLFKNVPVLDAGARGSTTTFVQRGIGDVLIAWENEALLAIKELGPGKFEIVAPSVSILAEPPVAVVDKVAEQARHRGGGAGLPGVPVHRRGPGDRGQALLPAAARGGRREVRRRSSPR